MGAALVVAAGSVPLTTSIVFGVVAAGDESSKSEPHEARARSPTTTSAARRTSVAEPAYRRRFVLPLRIDPDKKLEEGALAKLLPHGDAHLFQQRSSPPDHHALL